MFEDSLPGDATFRYHGTGTLVDRRLGTIKCGFEAAQFREGTIRLRCIVPSLLFTPAPYSSPIRLNGKTSNGNRLAFNGSSLITKSAPRFNAERRRRETMLVYTSTGDCALNVGRQTFSTPCEVRFPLTNLVFAGIDDIETLLLSLRGKTVTLFRLPDYERTLASMKANGGTDLTCEARITLRNNRALKSTKDLVAKLCTLLTFARGTLIANPYLELTDNAGEVFYREHRPAYTRPFVSDPVIDPRSGKDTKHFLESSFNNFMRLASVYQLQKVVAAYVDGRSGGYLETRGLVLGALAEFLVGIWAKHTNNAHIVYPKDFNALFEKKEKLERFEIMFPELKRDQLKDMAENVLCLINRPLRHKLRGLHGMPPEDKELDADIKSFVRTRNNLTHRMIFSKKSENDVQDFRHMAYFIDRVLLSILGYEGPFIDARTFDRYVFRPLLSTGLRKTKKK